MSQEKKDEGRYDIVKGLERAFHERGHKYSLEALLGHLDSQYRKDMQAVFVLLAHAKESIKDLGGCDHAVGLCVCSLMEAVEKVERIFPLSGSALAESQR